MPTAVPTRQNAESPGSDTRVDGWKAIATYLARGERTVKRWESERGLPIRRVPGGGKSSVYAFTSDLDQWLQSTSIQKSGDAPVPLSRSGSDLAAEDAGQFPHEDDPGSTAAFPGDSPFSAHPPAPTPSPLTFVSSWKLTPRGRLYLAFAAVLLISITGSAVYLAASGRVRTLLSPMLPAHFKKGQTQARTLGEQAASDAEKKLARGLYLKGRYEWGQRTPDSLNAALDSFTQAIVHDPGYAEAYVGLADTYELLEIYSTLAASDAYPRATAAAKKAVLLDDSLAEAHRALAFAEFYGSWDFVDSEKDFRRAIELNPRDPVVRRWYANAFAVPGRFAESLEQFDKAQELDPASHSTLSDKGMILFQAGRKDEAVSLLKEVERTDPEFYSPHFYLMIIALLGRDYPTYLDEGKKAAETSHDPVLKDIIASARTGYSKTGEGGLLAALYAKETAYYQAGRLIGSATMIARTCLLMGRKQEALQLIEQAYNRHEASVLWCLVCPDLLTLKDEPRFQALIKKINFPAPHTVTSKDVSATDIRSNAQKLQDSR
jgi:tetratricopeptide (TPR) repeat protein